MFTYRKRLLFPVHVDRPAPEFAEVLFEHYAGKDSELAAAVRYLNCRTYLGNRYLRELIGLLAAEELGHMEMLSVAIARLGLPLLCVNASDERLSLGCVECVQEPRTLLQNAVESEKRTRTLYEKDLPLVRDPGLSRMIEFLVRREQVHERLLEKAACCLEGGEPADGYLELIYEYKMSLQVLE